MADKIKTAHPVLAAMGVEAVTSYYDPARTDPVTGKENAGHLGIDLIDEHGREAYVLAFADGTVKATRDSYTGPTTDGSGGNYIRIDHGHGCMTLYKHLAKGTQTVKTGDIVKAGQILAVMGNTGHSTGRHLHFDVEINGVRVDPLPYLTGAASIGEKTLNGQRGANPKPVWPTKPDAQIKSLMQLLNSIDNARINADGIPGNRTYEYCRKHVIKIGVNGELSKWVQGRLKTLGYYNGLVDGVPGKLTMAAVHKLQADYGLPEGDCTGDTWYYLIA